MGLYWQPGPNRASGPDPAIAHPWTWRNCKAMRRYEVNELQRPPASNPFAPLPPPPPYVSLANGRCEGAGVPPSTEPPEASSPSQYPVRDLWGNRLEFVLSCLGYAVGLGNLWRFPHQVYKWGGGSFLLAYWIVMFIVALPMFVMELSLGQFTSRGPVQIFRHLAPAFEGFGYANVVVQAIAATIYNSVFGYSIMYLAASLFIYPNLPWDRCTGSINNNLCFSMQEFMSCSEQGGFYYHRSCWTNETAMDVFSEFQGRTGVDSCLKQSLSDDHFDLKSHDHCRVNISFAQLTNEESVFKVLNNLSTPLNTSSSENFSIFHESLSNKPVSLVWKSDQQRWTMEPQSFVGLSLDLASPDYSNQWNDLLQLNRRSPLIIADLVQNYCSEVLSSIDPAVSTRPNCLRAVLNQLDTSVEYASEQFYHAHIDAKDASWYDMKGISTYVLLGFIAAWVLTALGLLWGTKIMGKIVYLTALFPIAVVFIFVLYGMTLPGADAGYSFYLRANWLTLKDPQLWSAAAGQIFFSLSVGGGGLMTLASYNRFDNNILMDSLFIAVVDGLFSFVSGFGIFAIVGNMAQTMGTPVEDILANSGQGLAFITYAHSTGGMPSGRLFAVLFFSMLCFLAIDTSFTTVETVCTFIYDEWPRTRRWKWLVVSCVCCVMCVLGLPTITRGGSKFVAFIDMAVFDFAILLFAVLETVIVMYIYGAANFANDLTMMLGFRLMRKDGSINFGNLLWNRFTKWYWIVCWCLVAPAGVLFISVMTWADYANYGLPIYNPLFETPPEAKLLFWTIALGILPTFVAFYFILNYFRHGRYLSKLFKPTEHWGPLLDSNRTGRYKATQYERTLPVITIDACSNADLNCCRDDNSMDERYTLLKQSSTSSFLSDV